MHKLFKPCPKDAVCQISEYLECQFVGRRSFKFTKFYPFLPIFEPKSNGYFQTSLTEIGLVVLEKKSFKEKFTDDGRGHILVYIYIAHFCSGELKKLEV